MRARWAIWIAGGVLALAAVLLLLFVKPSCVSVQVLGETNGYQTVAITNDTPQLHYVTAWGEFYADDSWQRLSLTNTVHKLEPGSFIVTEVLMPTNRPKRVAFVYAPIKTGGLGAWISRARARLRIKSTVEHVYVEVE
jgi:hypothetical protein